MISLVISITVAFITFSQTGASGWSYFWAVLAFIAVQILSAILLRKKIGGIQTKIQTVIGDGQKALNNKLKLMQQRGNTNVKLMQKIAEADQKKFIEQALEVANELENYKKWSVLMGKQIATMRMQFNFQLKNYKESDKYMKKALFLDPMLYCMKLARMYKLKDDKELEKTFKKATTRYKGAKARLIYSTYAWIKVKQNDIDAAIKALNNAKKKDDNETLLKNLALLQNGKQNQFSNAAFGDMWYSLYLEEPKAKVQRGRQRQPKGNRPF